MAGESAKQQTAEVSKRHGLWLNRGRKAKGEKLIRWRPAPRYRVSAKKVLRAIDNQLKCGTSAGGLKFFKYSADKPEFSPNKWETWPYICMNFDLASEHVSGYYYGERVLQLNCDLFGDGAHGCNRDTMGALGISALKQFWQVMMISMNLPFGPMDNGEWGNQLDDTMAKIKTQYSRSSLPVLFRQEAPRMLRSLKLGQTDLPGLEDPEMELWDYCMEAGLRRRAGSKVTAARFCGSTASAQVNVEHWGIDKFCRTATHVCV